MQDVSGDGRGRVDTGHDVECRLTAGRLLPLRVSLPVALPAVAGRLYPRSLAQHGLMQWPGVRRRLCTCCTSVPRPLRDVPRHPGRPHPRRWVYCIPPRSETTSQSGWSSGDSIHWLAASATVWPSWHQRCHRWLHRVDPTCSGLTWYEPSSSTQRCSVFRHPGTYPKKPGGFFGYTHLKTHSKKPTLLL